MIKYWSFTCLCLSLFCSLSLLISCSPNKQVEEEQVVLNDQAEILPDSLLVNAIRSKQSLSLISTQPHTVVLTGLAQHRLVTIYKTGTRQVSNDGYLSSRKSYYEPSYREYEEHYMPGLDLLYGYNLLSIAHYDLTSEKLNFLFDHPVLIKSLYYPSFVQDSLYKKPINRDYFMVSVYDEDTNGDTLITKADLRRFYHFNAAGNERLLLTPPDYSVVRSEYDPMNDVMYVFARHDVDKNGRTTKKEPLHIFWFSLKKPTQAKRLY